MCMANEWFMSNENPWPFSIQHGVFLKGVPMRDGVLYQTERVNDIECMVDSCCKTNPVRTHTLGFRSVLPSANNDM